MWGRLPKALEVRGKRYTINPDFRNILQIMAAFADDELKPEEKAYICIKRLYVDMESIPREDIEEAYIQALQFMEYGSERDGKEHRHKLIDWERDEAIIFPAINKVAGCEVREVDYMHWWTFLGHFQSIDSESLLGTVLSIRQKKSRGKKLEKWEREFERNNRDLCALVPVKKQPKPEDKLTEMFNSLLAEGA